MSERVSQRVLKTSRFGARTVKWHEDVRESQSTLAVTCNLFLDDS
jgi:hypothetical protein